jgi:diguanylate cyclase (GGDEF)-like protein
MLGALRGPVGAEKGKMLWIGLLGLLMGLALGGLAMEALRRRFREREQALAREAQEAARALAGARTRLAAVQAELAASRASLEAAERKDALTGLYNKEVFQETLESEWRRGFRYGASLSLLLIQTDGDGPQSSIAREPETIRAVGELLGQTLQRPGDMTAHLGDSTFGAILSGTDAEGAAEAGEILRSKVEEIRLAQDDKGPWRSVTVSVGAATAYPGKGLSYERLMGAAKEALSKARSEGGNRVAVADMLWPE